MSAENGGALSPFFYFWVFTAEDKSKT